MTGSEIFTVRLVITWTSRNLPRQSSIPAVCFNSGTHWARPSSWAKPRNRDVPRKVFGSHQAPTKPPSLHQATKPPPSHQASTKPPSLHQATKPPPSHKVCQEKLLINITNPDWLHQSAYDIQFDPATWIEPNESCNFITGPLRICGPVRPQAKHTGTDTDLGAPGIDIGASPLGWDGKYQRK